MARPTTARSRPSGAIRHSIRTLVTRLLLLAALAALAAPGASAQTVFASGINNPRGIAQLRDGRVLVTAFRGQTVVRAATGTGVVSRRLTVVR